MNLENKNILDPLIKECKKGDRKAQKKLYMLFFPYAKSICLRYTKSEDEAMEILNDGFLKIFTKLDQHLPNQSFKAWARRIFVNTAIDQYRRNTNHRHTLEIEKADTEFIDPEVIDRVSAEEILRIVGNLSPAYRMVFNLYVVEGYNHKEIGKKLGISEGTSKSNLAKARMKLKKMIVELNKEDFSHYG
ncbi:RNA polymerase sigma factor [Fulvivirgaceae bacterium BMA10]|uniref:RNA polymerase sigma factor n=1 Tax=Splendidivirga corallicola TaxID=3051826 RepID=A0ABT8KHH6_9BACT|nr:RNA polymerase sigma factor [Fulvivirgaceae bacterium BMA10]